MTVQAILPIIYWAFSFTCFLAIWRRGGRDERFTAAAMMLASVASLVAVLTSASDPQVATVKTKIAIIDLALFAAVGAIALRSERFWPLWAAAITLIVMITHLAQWIAPEIVPRVYLIAQGFWAYPGWLTVLIGALFESRPSHPSQT